MKKARALRRISRKKRRAARKMKRKARKMKRKARRSKRRARRSQRKALRKKAAGGAKGKGDCLNCQKVGAVKALKKVQDEVTKEMKKLRR